MIGDIMKKIVFFIIMILLPISVHADNILDDYSVDIKMNGKEIHIIEKFKVIENDDNNSNFSKKMLATENNLKLNNCNINNYKLLYELAYNPYVIGNIEKNKEYLIEYTISDFTIFGTNAFIFNSPEDTIINHLTFRVEYNDNLADVSIWDHQGEKYEVITDGNIITGILTEPTDNARFDIFLYK